MTRSPTWCLELHTASPLTSCGRAHLTRSSCPPWWASGREAQCWSLPGPVSPVYCHNFLEKIIFSFDFGNHIIGKFKYYNGKIKSNVPSHCFSGSPKSKWLCSAEHHTQQRYAQLDTSDWRLWLSPHLEAHLRSEREWYTSVRSCRTDDLLRVTPCNRRLMFPGNKNLFSSSVGD